MDHGVIEGFFPEYIEIEAATVLGVTVGSWLLCSYVTDPQCFLALLKGAKTQWNQGQELKRRLIVKARLWKSDLELFSLKKQHMIIPKHGCLHPCLCRQSFYQAQLLTDCRVKSSLHTTMYLYTLWQKLNVFWPVPSAKRLGCMKCWSSFPHKYGCSACAICFPCSSRTMQLASLLVEQSKVSGSACKEYAYAPVVGHLYAYMP